MSFGILNLYILKYSTRIAICITRSVNLKTILISAIFLCGQRGQTAEYTFRSHLSKLKDQILLSVKEVE